MFVLRRWLLAVFGLVRSELSVYLFCCDDRPRVKEKYLNTCLIKHARCVANLYSNCWTGNGRGGLVKYGAGICLPREGLQAFI